MVTDRNEERNDFGLSDDEVVFVDDEAEPELDSGTDAHVMTVLGPVRPDALGVTLRHEHLLAAPPAAVDMALDLRIDDWQAALADAESVQFAGGGTIVDCTPPDNGRDLAGLRWVGQRVGVHIVATAGFHKEAHSRPFVEGRTARELAAGLVHELRDGDPSTGVRPGQLKAGSSLGRITATEGIAFEAVALAHRATGAPVITHAEAGTMGREQVDLLASLGVPADRVTVSHLDRRFDDADLLRSVLATGAFIGFDQLGKPRYGPDEPKAAVIAGLVADGFGGQILLSQDMARRSLRPAYGGGPGLTWLLDRFVFMLLDAGVDAADVRRILVDNPARALTIQPSRGAA